MASARRSPGSGTRRYCDRTVVLESSRGRAAPLGGAERLRGRVIGGGVASKLLSDCSLLRGCSGKYGESRSVRARHARERGGARGVDERRQFDGGHGGGRCCRIESYAGRRGVALHPTDVTASSGRGGEACWQHGSFRAPHAHLFPLIGRLSSFNVRLSLSQSVRPCMRSARSSNCPR